MMRVFLFIAVVVFMGFSGYVPVPVFASDNVLTVDLAQDHVDITTGFDGAQLSLFGVKKHGGQVAIVVKGPSRDALVRKKSSVGGIWMNRSSLRFKDVPQFYDFALSDAEENILTDDLRRDAGIGFASLKFDPVKNGYEEEERKAFQRALVRNRQVAGLFPLEAKDIIFLSDTFFKTEFYVPPNVPMGQYVIETFLISKGRIVDKRTTNVRVAQVGFSSIIYRIANSHSLAYAVGIVLLAVLAGWLSNAVRKYNK